ncbi:response regulator [Aerophototrophica crusticola]|uniref:response regulator n=1 Tax=Aerophototrophica crusticola TaxID=1709002 RepID=UPI000A77B4FC
MTDSDDLDDLFAPEDGDEGGEGHLAAHGVPWPVLVVDDDEEVHIMTRLVLGKLRYNDRPLELLMAHSAAEAEDILRRRDDIAVALLDIVMETDDAGLRLARKIREEFGNSDVRIVLRTGQPGQAPVRDVIVSYDINDYKSKTELTSEKLFITIVTGLRSYDNIRSARAAESASRLKSSFLAAMSHEIRTPMNGVLGMLELMAHTSLTSDQREMLGTARESAGTLLHIIDDILDFSKIEAGRMDIDRHPLDLPALVEGVAETLVPNARKKGLAFHVHVDPAIPDRLLGDPVRLRQVLFNLAGNAIKFTEHGGVVIRAERLSGGGEGWVTVRVSVTDSGIGIEESVQAKLFQPFTQAEKSTSRRFGGTGLGLSICRRLMELMKGQIGLDSCPGQGSTFWFTVALEEEPGRDDRAKPPLTGIRVRLETVDLTLAGTVGAYLGAAGATLAEAGEDADVLVMGNGTGEDWAVPSAGLPAVIIADADSRRPLDLAPDARLVARPVRRLALVRAVAAAAGRGQEADSGPSAALLRPTREPPPREEAQARGTLVLVAEDQAVNQMVVRRQLGLLGVACDVFPSGRQALEAWRRGGYGLVLTDCNMPDMDGFELTEAIRAAEAGTGRHVPVIALTANAMAGEDQRCIRAGMDDFLAKPVDLTRLDQCLRRWLPAALEPLAPGAVAGGGGPGLVPFDPAMTLELFGSIDTDARDFLRQFTDSARPLLGAVEAALAEGELEEARHQAHALAGVCKAGGATELAALADRVEQALLAGQPELARSAAADLPGAFQRMERSIQTL